MIIIGLTGSIGMGKSFAAEQFKACGAEVFDADAEVHALLEKGGIAVETVGNIFHDTLEDNKINREKLAKEVFSDNEKLKKLEAIIHPLVFNSANKFLGNCTKNKVKLVVLDIPLLFETEMHHTCDVIVVVSAPEDIQKQRAMKRDNMSEKRFKKINELQLSVKEKEFLADYVISSALGKEATVIQVKDIVKELLS